MDTYAREDMARSVIKVLLLEDASSEGDAVNAELLAADAQLEVQRVATEAAFQKALNDFHPDVVLATPTPDGFSFRGAQQMLRTMKPGVPLIVVTRQLDEQSAVDCLRGGADDFVLTGNLSRLVPAIQGSLAVRRPLTRLSPRQLEVLRLVAEGKSTRDIAEQLALSMKTVESHRGAVMKRLELHNVADLVRYAVRTGMVAADVAGTPRAARRSPVATEQP